MKLKRKVNKQLTEKVISQRKIKILCLVAHIGFDHNRVFVKKSGALIIVCKFLLQLKTKIKINLSLKRPAVI